MIPKPSAIVGIVPISLTSGKRDKIESNPGGQIASVYVYGDTNHGDEFVLTLHHAGAVAWQGFWRGPLMEPYGTPPLILTHEWDWTLRKTAGLDRRLEWDLRSYRLTTERAL